MEGKVYEIPLDVADGALKVQVIVLVTEDLGTNTFRFNLVKNKRIPFDLTGTIVRMMVKTPSGARIQQECVVENALGGALRLTLKQSLLTERGSHIAELQVFDAITQSIRLTTPTFDYHVRQSLQNSESIVATDEYTILQEALADLAGINIVVANKADKSDVGDIEDLTTTEKENLVAAINEVTLQSNEIAEDVTDVGSTLVKTFQNRTDITSGININTLKVVGSYRLIATHVNCPVEYGVLNVYKPSDDYVVQIAFDITSDYAYMRSSHNDGVSWTAWKELATTDKTEITFPVSAGFTIGVGNANTVIRDSMGLVTVNYGVQVNTPSATNKAIGILPVGFRPKDSITFVGRANIAPIPIPMTISNSGIIETRNNGTTSLDYLFGTVSFYVN